MISILRHRWTVPGFFLRLALLILLGALGTHVVLRIFVSPQEQILFPVSMDIRPAISWCLREVGSPSGYRECQDRFYKRGGNSNEVSR